MTSDATRPSPRAPYGAPRSDRDLSRPLPAALSWGVLVAFVTVLTVAVVWFDMPAWMLAFYAGMSVIAFAAYGVDKSAARRGAGRVSEQTLLTLSLLCGWPGALVAQQVFRHKTRKRSFRRVFWGTVTLNVLLLAVVFAATTAWGWDLGAVRDGFVSLFE
jgi:uncharacterized membrane protein YsdA (DUF1294 family)